MARNDPGVRRSVPFPTFKPTFRGLENRDPRRFDPTEHGEDRVGPTGRWSDHVNN